MATRGRRRRTVQATNVSAAISANLADYGEEVSQQLKQITEAAMADLVQRTKATAPKGRRGKYARQITSESKTTAVGTKCTWYVKAPDYRLTHLLVHGHATRDGGRTRANPFLQNALDQVLPDFENALKEAIRNG